MYEVFFKFYSCNEDIKPSAAFSCRHIKYKIHAPECTKTRHFYFKNSKNFLGRGHSPIRRLLPQREGDTRSRSRTHPLGVCAAAPRSSRLRRSLMHSPLGSLTTGLQLFRIWTKMSITFWESFLQICQPNGNSVAVAERRLKGETRR